VVVQQLEEGVSLVRLCDRQGRNHVDLLLMQELLQALRHLSAQPEPRVVVLAGLEDVFCAGASPEFLKQLVEGEDTTTRLYEAGLELLRFPLPVVCAAEGVALGGGWMLVLCADLRVGCETSRYGANFTQLGLTPGMLSTGLVPLAAGHARATELLLTGRTLTGRELGLQFFNAVVPRHQVLPKALELAHQVARRPRQWLTLWKASTLESRLAQVHRCISSEAPGLLASLRHPLFSNRQQSP
jgi:polyketide biosynthesis enoyl-CoA hydratase PksI